VVGHLATQHVWLARVLLVFIGGEKSLAPSHPKPDAFGAECSNAHACSYKTPVTTLPGTLARNLLTSVGVF
jgi:hypothetical protein